MEIPKPFVYIFCAVVLVVLGFVAGSVLPHAPAPVPSAAECHCHCLACNCGDKCNRVPAPRRGILGAIK